MAISQKEQAPSTVADRHRHGRHRIPEGDEAHIEFDHPADQHWRLPLLDLSECGLSCGLPGQPPAIDATSILPDVVVRLLGYEIRGTLSVTHLRSVATTGTVCGGRFDPASDDDRAKLDSVLHVLAQTPPP